MLKRLLIGLLSLPLISVSLGVIFVNNSHAETSLQDDAGLPQVRYENGKYRNIDASVVQDMSNIGSILWRYITEKRVDPTPTTQVPVHQLDENALASQAHTSLFRLGHSSILLNFSGEIWLTDPVFSERTSPVQWVGPKRFHPAPIELEQFSNIAGVVISHNHYDHLDKASIQALHHKVSHFLVPLGVGETLIDWGVPKSKIQELTWWQTVTVGKLTITATPTQHFSGRGLFDSDKSLWASWVFQTPETRIFFSGDSGYFDGFKQIGDKFGPFDITLMETGAYDKDWPDIHMHPAQSLQAHMDLRGKVLIPIHNSTFDLAMHPWYHPLEELTQLAQAKQQQVLTPIIGQAVNIQANAQIANLNSYHYWWRHMVPSLNGNVQRSIAQTESEAELSATPPTLATTE